MAPISANTSSKRRSNMAHVLLLAAICLTILGLSACTGADGPDWVFAQESFTQTPFPQTSLPQTSSSPNIPAVQDAPVSSEPVATSTPLAVDHPVAPPGSTLILAHYVTWFKTRPFSGYWQHWQWDPNGDGQFDEGDSLPDRIGEDGLREIAAVDYPRFGPYDSADPALIEYHVATAWAAGIDGFVVDWYGPQDAGGIDRAFAHLLATVSRWRQQHGLRFFVGINYEEKILSGVDAPDRAETMIQQLAGILESYATAPAYLTYQDLPVIFFFQAWQGPQPGLLSPDQLAQVRSALPPHILLYMGAENNFLDVTDGFFSWVSGANENPQDWGSDYANWVYPEMDRQAQERGLALTVGSVWAGFDDSGVGGWGDTPRFIDGQGGAVYEETWALALAAKAERGPDAPSWVQIVTWNDWNEGTQIEPTLAHGTALLADTQDQARAYTGRDMPALALEIPAQIMALRQDDPGPESEALIQKVYAHLFAGNFAAAATLLPATD